MSGPKPWPKDPTEGARLILEAIHGLLTGPGAPAFLKVSLGGQEIRIKAGELIDTAETIVEECMIRSQRRYEANTPKSGIDFHG